MLKRGVTHPKVFPESSCSTGNSYKIPWIAWNSTVASKAKGGLGIGSLKSLNHALIQKWRWRFLKTPTALWVMTIKAIHGLNEDSFIFNCSVKGDGVLARIVKDINAINDQGLIPHQTGALRSPRKELRNELKYVQSGVKMNEISCLKVRHVEHKTWELEAIHIAQKGKMTNTQTPPLATTVVNTTGAPVTNTVVNHAERPEKFNGQNFKRWQQKMFFYLTTLCLARFLKETVPQVEPPAEGHSSNAQAVQATTTAKELWESLERKYKTKDAGTKKFVVAHFLDYKMVDSKNAISQLPQSWVDFKKYLKHKRKEMSVEDLVVRLRIEEDNRLAQKDTYTPDSAKANMIELVRSSSRSNPKGKGKDKRKNDKKSKGKSEYLSHKARIMKQKFQGTCYNCDQPGHRAANCKMLARCRKRNGLITPHPMITDPPPTDLLLSLHQGRNLIMNSREEENKLRDADTQAEIHFSQDLTHLKATCSCQKDSQENRSSSTSIGDHWPMLPHITTAPVLLYTLNFKSSSHAQSSNDALDGHYDSIA
ncbi:zinc finger, CCHC-type containing protein [Tanacetum coccineum]